MTQRTLWLNIYLKPPPINGLDKLVSSRAQSRQVKVVHLSTLTLSDITQHRFLTDLFDGVTSKRIIKILLEVITANLCLGEGLRLKGIGGLVVTQKAPRLGRDMVRNEPVIIPARKTVSLVSGRKKRSVIFMLDFVKQCAETHPQFSVSEYTAAYLALVDVVSKVSEGDKRLELRDFGVFSPSEISAKTKVSGVQGGISFKDERHFLIRFKISKNLSLKINSTELSE